MKFCEMENIFAIIVTWNGMKFNWIKQCLDSLRNSDQPVGIIVIDNASSDETGDFIRQNYSEVILIASEVNLGFGAANNLGLRKGLELSGEYFFLLNQDAWVDADCIGKLVEHSRKQPRYGIISPIHLTSKGDTLDPFFSTTITPEKCPGLYSDFVLEQVQDRIYQSQFVNAAAWLITRECLRIVGGFSPVFDHYAEDDNFVHRLLFKNLKIGVYPKTFIYHDKENSKTSAHADDKKFRQRMTILELSNPARKFDFKHYDLFYIKQSFKKIATLNFKGARPYIEDFIYIKERRDRIEEARTESISANDYIFLKDSVR